jgi:glutamate synthase (NADPH/NADH) small chain
VTIKSVECAIVDKGWEEGWILPHPPKAKTGKSIGVIGAGPAGMAAAQQLARTGHDVHLYEKNAKAGGLLRYGIPDFKMEKHSIDRRVEQMQAEGVTFHYETLVGVDLTAAELEAKHDALILSGGSEVPRDLPVPGRDLDGVHYAMDFLPQQNRRVGQELIGEIEPILAEGKHVIVIGGGDTGSDCIGTSFRQGALSVTQLEIMPMPPEKENKGLTWPDWPLKMRTSTSQEEGAIRDFSVMTTEIIGADGKVTAIKCTKVDENTAPIAGSEFELQADLVLLAMGFIHPVHDGLVEELALEKDGRGNVAADTATYETSRDKVFACGDMRRGQSLVVWAIREGRQAAREVDFFLMGETVLPR